MPRGGGRGDLDLLVLTSDTETSPVSILEAMACGKPVVAPRVGSVPETVRHGLTGYLTEPGDEADLTCRVTELLEAPEHARELGRAGPGPCLGPALLEGTRAARRL